MNDLPGLFASRLSLSRAVVLVVAWLASLTPFAAAHAQLSADAAQPSPLSALWGLQLAPQLEEHPLQAGQASAKFVLGDRAEGTADQDVWVQGNAEVRSDRTVIKGDRLHYDQDTDVADAYGHVRIVHDGNRFSGPEAHLRVGANEGYLINPTYHFNVSGGSGSARQVAVLDPDRLVVDHGTYTTCQCASDPAWYLRASRLEIDQGNDTGVVHNAVLFFQRVPLFATPYLSFPLSNARRSGFLPPTFDLNSRSGIDISLPYYFNIAPNRDFTLMPRIMSQRGMQWAGTYRYLSPTYGGTATVEYLPHDEITKTTRYAIFAQHTQNLGNGWGAYLNYNRVSDNLYPGDLTPSNNFILNGAQLLYQQEAGVTYNRGPWSILARVQRWQTLPPSTAPYAREPELNVKYDKYNVGGFDYGAEADYSNFTITTADSFEGQRVYLNPTVSYPIITPSYFVVPKIRYHLAAYELNHIPLNAPPGQARDLTSSIPTLSLDSGLQFERRTHWLGQDYIQTLEPRVYYVYTPFQDQSAIPLFDTAEADFGLAEIFTDNTYVGNDRIADANRVTAGLTTRFIRPDSGDERARFVLAEQYYFRRQQTTIPGQTAAQADHSDIITGASVKLVPDFASSTAFQYNFNRDQLVRATFGLAWSPEDRKVLNVAYRYTRLATLSNQPINQVVLSSQWPLTQRLYSVGRINYDMSGHRLVNALVGFQYDADCWSLGLALQKYTNGIDLNGATVSGHRVLAQLELKGFSKIDNGLIQQFRASVPGYQPLPVSPPPSRFSDYE